MELLFYHRGDDSKFPESTTFVNHQLKPHHSQLNNQIADCVGGRVSVLMAAPHHSVVALIKD